MASLGQHFNNGTWFFMDQHSQVTRDFEISGPGEWYCIKKISVITIFA